MGCFAAGQVVLPRQDLAVRAPRSASLDRDAGRRSGCRGRTRARRSEEHDDTRPRTQPAPGAPRANRRRVMTRSVGGCRGPTIPRRRGRRRRARSRSRRSSEEGDVGGGRRRVLQRLVDATVAGPSRAGPASPPPGAGGLGGLLRLRLLRGERLGARGAPPAARPPAPPGCIVTPLGRPAVAWAVPTKHLSAGGAPGIFTIASIAMLHERRGQPRVPELRRDDLALAHRVTEELRRASRPCRRRSPRSARARTSTSTGSTRADRAR